MIVIVAFYGDSGGGLDIRFYPEPEKNIVGLLKDVLAHKEAGKMVRIFEINSLVEQPVEVV